MKLFVIFIIGLALLNNGCTSVSSSTEEESKGLQYEAWEMQQRQEATKHEATMENDPLGMTLYYAVLFSMMGYGASSGK